MLSYLDSAKAAEVFGAPQPGHAGGGHRAAGHDRVDVRSTWSGKIARSLGKHFDTKARPTFHHSGGVRAVADLLNRLDKEMSKTLLARLEDRNAALGAAIRKKMFSFEDLNRLQPARPAAGHARGRHHRPGDWR